MLIVFTAIVGMFLAVPGWPGARPCCSERSASAWRVIRRRFNHVLDARIDIQMLRTRGRPLPQGRVSERAALTFATVLCDHLDDHSVVPGQSADRGSDVCSLIGYAVIYTVF